MLPRAALAFLPVLVFLASLKILDSFRLVRARRIWLALAAGCLGGLASYIVNSALLDLTRLPILQFAILVAPVVEEILKAAYLAWLIRNGRISFLIEAAILGFAVGAGFSIVENLYYLAQLPNAPLLVWIIRGFGTAVMHAGVTGILAIMVVGLQNSSRLSALLNWLAAIVTVSVLHGLFNRGLVKPILATAVVMIVLPLVLRAAYGIGERRLRAWLGTGFDRDTEILSLIRDGQVRTTPLGRYLVSLRTTFRPDTVADMLCLVRLQAELAIRAKGLLVLQEHGLKPVADPEVAARLKEVRWLEQTIGKTGLLALRPVGHWRGRDRWQRYLLEDESG